MIKSCLEESDYVRADMNLYKLNMEYEAILSEPSYIHYLFKKLEPIKSTYYTRIIY